MLEEVVKYIHKDFFSFFLSSRQATSPYTLTVSEHPQSTRRRGEADGAAGRILPEV